MSKLSESEFKSIVHSVIENTDDPRVVNFSIYGFSVEVFFRSKSRKSKWNTVLKFDEVTGDYTYHEVYPGAAGPWVIGNKISSIIKEMLNN